MKLGVLILNWNGLNDTRECLQSLLPSPDWSVIYVVDNGSRDDSVRVLKSEFGTQIKVIETGENLLFAGGNNFGIEIALKDGCDAILLLNNDTILEADTLPNLLTASNRNPNKLLCPKILYAGDRKSLWYAGGIWSGGRIAHRGIRETDNGQYDVEQTTGWGTGCALWIPRNVVETVGVLDHDFKLYYEDVEYCLRAKAHGFETVYAPSARLWHKVSASLGGHGTFRKQRRKFSSLGLLLEKIDAPPTTLFFAYLNFFAFDPLRALIKKIVR